MDNQAAICLKRELAEELRIQLAMGDRNDADETGLCRLICSLGIKQAG